MTGGSTFTAGPAIQQELRQVELLAAEADGDSVQVVGPGFVVSARTRHHGGAFGQQLFEAARRDAERLCKFRPLVRQRLRFAAFPLPDGSRVEAQFDGQRLLGVASCLTSPDEPVAPRSHDSLPRSPPEVIRLPHVRSLNARSPTDSPRMYALVIQLDDPRRSISAPWWLVDHLASPSDVSPGHQGCHPRPAATENHDLETEIRRRASVRSRMAERGRPRSVRVAQPRTSRASSPS